MYKVMLDVSQALALWALRRVSRNFGHTPLRGTLGLGFRVEGGLQESILKFCPSVTVGFRGDSPLPDFKVFLRALRVRVLNNHIPCKTFATLISTYQIPSTEL